MWYKFVDTYPTLDFDRKASLTMIILIHIIIFHRNLQPVESWFVSFISLGEGWHNYHHAFPWDYKAAELSKLFNLSADIIKIFENVGLAWDLKTASPEVVSVFKIIVNFISTNMLH